MTTTAQPAAPTASATTAPLSPMQKTVLTKTDYWNDSCSIEELTYGIEHGAVGATTNPSIVLAVLKKEMHLWHDHILGLIADNPTWTENDVQWKLIEDMAIRGAQAAGARLRALPGQEGPPLDPDRSPQLPGCGCHCQASGLL